MAISKKILHDTIRNKYMEMVANFLRDNGEEVLATGSNEFALPCVDAEGNDEYIVMTFKVPKGSRDGEPYDGYSMAEDYKMRLEAKAAKVAENAKKKAEKIKRDEEMRKAKAEAKAKREKGE